MKSLFFGRCGEHPTVSGQSDMAHAVYRMGLRKERLRRRTTGLLKQSRKRCGNLIQGSSEVGVNEGHLEEAGFCSGEGWGSSKRKDIA